VDETGPGTFCTASYVNMGENNVYAGKRGRIARRPRCKGSITIDAELAERAQLMENELVQVVNINNGARFGRN
jgi:hypothetical protein